LATKAATELTHALLNPQPAGPFCKVGDEQTLALKRLADIFEGATRRKSRVVIPPAETVGNNAPPRVQNTVSPPRVQNTATQQRVAHQTTASHLTPNSHRRTHTPHRRAVRPPTPYVMVRRSTSQKTNLSQDMIAETINQANHCFSFPTTPTLTKKLSTMSRSYSCPKWQMLQFVLKQANHSNTRNSSQN
jgi:hypothetical protein